MLISVLFAGSVYALPAGGLAGFTGTEDFSYTANGWNMTGHIDYAVYEAADWTGVFAPDADYVYAYQVFNDAGSVGIVDSLSVILSPGASLGSIGVEGVSGGVSPFFSYFSPDITNAQSSLYLFLPAFPGNSSGGFVDPGDKSFLLFFTSDDAPKMGQGVLSNQGITVSLPTVAPEPATIALLGLGSLAVIRRRRSA